MQPARRLGKRACKNTTGSPADISGWFLTDEFYFPQKFVIPANTIVPAGGFLVLYATNSFGNTNLPNNFRLDAQGDRRGQAADLPPRGLELHEDRRESLRQVVVNIARETIALFKNAFAAFLEAIELDETAVMQRECRLTRNRFDEDHAPPLTRGF